MARSNTLPRNVVSKPGEGRVESFLGVSHIYKAEAEQTGGNLVCIELTTPAGHGIPPHRHSEEDESFYVLAGQVVIEGDGIEGRSVTLAAGSFFYGPRDQVHGFRNPGPEPAKLLVFVTPGSGVEAMFRELAALTKTMGEKVEPAQVGEVCGRYGIEFVRK